MRRFWLIYNIFFLVFCVALTIHDIIINSAFYAAWFAALAGTFIIMLVVEVEK